MLHPTHGGHDIMPTSVHGTKNGKLEAFEGPWIPWRDSNRTILPYQVDIIESILMKRRKVLSQFWEIYILVWKLAKIAHRGPLRSLEWINQSYIFTGVSKHLIDIIFKRKKRQILLFVTSYANLRKSTHTTSIRPPTVKTLVNWW